MNAGAARSSRIARARAWVAGGRRWTGLPVVLTLLFAVHLGFGLVRLPSGSIHKRIESVREWRERGVDGWCFRLADDETRRVARWLRERVGPSHLVRIAGEGRGSFQLLAPILFPALLVYASAPEAWPADRPVFEERAPWLTSAAGTHLVVVATPSTLRLEYR